MTKQDQKVGEGASAYQAGGNIVVNQNLSAEQMLELMEAVAGRLQKFEAKAEETFRNRLDDFHHKIIEEFAREGSRADSTAFEDPDYQFVLREAQNTYGRSGEEALREELVRLLSERSVEKSRTRKALALNEAISTVGNLTEQEFSALAMIFLTRNVRVICQYRSALYQRLNTLITPFIDSLPQESFSYEYLESMRCISINHLSSSDIWQIFIDDYGMLYSLGFAPNRIDEIVTNTEERRKLNRYLVDIEGDFSGKRRFKADNRANLEKSLLEEGFGPETLERLLKLHDESIISTEQIKKEAIDSVPAFGRLAEVWMTSGLKTSTLTALGKVVAHSAFTSRTRFEAPLEIWVQ